jgi:hypothetical protein
VLIQKLQNAAIIEKVQSLPLMQTDMPLLLDFIKKCRTEEVIHIKLISTLMHLLTHDTIDTANPTLIGNVSPTTTSIDL